MIALALTGLTLLAARPAAAACTDVLPTREKRTTAQRAVTADDILRLRDIGQPDGAIVGQPSPLAISPDGKKLTFIISRADPASNGYCRALVSIDIAGRDPPLVLDRGGDMITNITVARGLIIGNGFPTLIAPRWSPDGRWLAYLRRDNGKTQIWRARADGSGASQVTRSPTDVLDVAWTVDGRLVGATMAGEPGFEAALDQESRKGWLYDARIAPNIAARPREPGTLAREAFVIDPANGATMAATDADRTRVALTDLSGSPIPPSAVSPTGRRAWTEHEGLSPLSPLQLEADTRSGPVTCSSDLCHGQLIGLWWDRADLIYLRREGWANGQMALYRWSVGAATPRRILLTDNVLIGCVYETERLFCTSENATTPRRIVSVDLHGGLVRDVFDPNPEFRTLRLGSVERLKWRNDRGLEAWGDLVLPPGYQPGHEKLPMIIVQYHSDGFLRGGTGDEYPIYAFAARGFAVLSIENPSLIANQSKNIRSYDDVLAANSKDWAERRSLLSSLETGIRQVIARGIADPARIGITGLSDGSSTVRFALVNTRLFAAASISTCCIEPKTAMTYGGIGLADALRKAGYPPASKDDVAFWKPYSLALNARDLHVPLLMQVADDEYLLALETYTALRENGQPVEMYIFPGEHHIKWQSAHRRAIYERNLDWFDFWLRDRRDPAPDKVAQYQRWQQMRDHQKAVTGS